MINDLYGKDKYPSHIELGREYWYYFNDDTEIYKTTHKHWNKLKISYIRSGCLFYVFPDAPDVSEEFCPIKCFMASRFILAEIDPIKDLGNELENIELAKNLYYFDDDLTVVKNWPNGKEIEVDKDESFSIINILAETK